MCPGRSRWLVAATLSALAPTFSSADSSSSAAKPTPPKMMLWSWYAEDDLRFLKDPGIGVAYLGLTIRFEGRDKVLPQPRFLPLRMSPDTFQMLVVRFDYDSWNKGRQPAFSGQQRQLAVKMIEEISALSHARAVQIDFDAPASAYLFYRQLLANLRNQLGPQVFLSITALVSWCEKSESWLNGLPVDEIVPMAFYMGKATPAVTTMLQRGGQFSYPGCRSSIGAQLGYGTPINPHEDQRAYFFAQPSRWSPESVRAAKEAILP